MNPLYLWRIEMQAETFFLDWDIEKVCTISFLHNVPFELVSCESILVHNAFVSKCYNTSSVS